MQTTVQRLQHLEYPCPISRVRKWKYKEIQQLTQRVTDCVSCANDFTVRWSGPECVYTALDSQTE